MTAIEGVTPAGAGPWWPSVRERIAGATDFAEATATYPRPFRRAVTVYAIAVLALTILLAPVAPDQVSAIALSNWLGLLVSGPALVLSAVAARRARPAGGELVFWRRWTVAIAAVMANGAALQVVSFEDVRGLRALAPVAVGVSVAVFMVCNITLMRRRAGGRSVALDAVETALATVILTNAIALVIGDRMLHSPAPWYTYSCAVALIGCIIGLVWVSVLFRRTPAHHRRIELIGIVLAVLATLDASAQLAQGLSGFTLATPPLLVLNQLTMTVLLLVPLHASRVRIPGLDRFAPQHQVRGSSLPTVVTLVAIPALAAIAIVRLDRAPWMVEVFAASAAELAVLLALRALLAMNETKRLYRAVEADAEERRRVLGALARSLDGDRQRVASQLHQQAIASYVTFSTYLQSASRVLPSGVPLPETSEKLREDLNQTAERWREFMLTVGATSSGPTVPSAGLRIAIVAQILALTDDEGGPALTVEVDGDLHLDWATESLVLRIVQEAVMHLHRTRLVSKVSVAVAAHPDGLEVRVVAEGAERTAGRVPPRLDEVRSFVALGNGELDVRDEGANGTVVVARLQPFGPARAHQRPRQPALRVVPPT